MKKPNFLDCVINLGIVILLTYAGCMLVIIWPVALLTAAFLSLAGICYGGWWLIWKFKSKQE